MSPEKEIPFKARLHWYRYEDPQEFPLLIAMLEHDSTGQHIDASRSRLAAYAKLSLRTVEYLLYGRPASKFGHNAKRGLIVRRVVTEMNPANAKGKPQPAQYRINEAAMELDPRMKPEWIKGKPQMALFQPMPKKAYVPPVIQDDAPPYPRAYTHAQCAGVDRELVAKSLAQIVENPDRRGVERIIQACVSNRPDVTTEEIGFWLGMKAREIDRGKVENPMGFLIAVLPECFAGETFTEWRNLRAAEVDRKAAEVEIQAAARASILGHCQGCGRPRFASSSWLDFCTPSCRTAHESRTTH